MQRSSAGGEQHDEARPRASLPQVVLHTALAYHRCAGMTEFLLTPGTVASIASGRILETFHRQVGLPQMPGPCPDRAPAWEMGFMHWPSATPHSQPDPKLPKPHRLQREPRTFFFANLATPCPLRAPLHIALGHIAAATCSRPRQPRVAVLPCQQGSERINADPIFMRSGRLRIVARNEDGVCQPAATAQYRGWNPRRE